MWQSHFEGASVHKQIQRLVTAGAILGIAGLAMACSSSKDDKDKTLTTSATTSVGASATATGSTSASGAKIPDRTITAKDYSFDFPDKIDGGLVRFKLDNQGKQVHQAQIARINDGVSMTQFDTAAKGQDPGAVIPLITALGGPNAVDPGKSQTVGDNLMQPGQYVLLCFVSDDDDIPHTAKGMVKHFEVTAPAAAQAAPPDAKASITLADFSFKGTETITSGKGTIAVTNNGPQIHEAEIIKLNNGLTVDQLKGIIDGSTPPPSGPPPIEEAGGLVALASGGKGWFDTDLAAGNYAFICFIPDQKTGEPHASLGMLQGFTIK
jgi:hypothetical protein